MPSRGRQFEPGWKHFFLRPLAVAAVHVLEDGPFVEQLVAQLVGKRVQRAALRDHRRVDIKTPFFNPSYANIMWFQVKLHGSAWAGWS